jgi:hypothetical protein
MLSLAFIELLHSHQSQFNYDLLTAIKNRKNQYYLEMTIITERVFSGKMIINNLVTKVNIHTED